MRSILFVAIGSRGDVQPIVALSSYLLNTHLIDKAHLQVTSDYSGLVDKDPRVQLHNHPHNSMAAFYATSSVLRRAARAGEDAVATSRRAVGRIVHDRVTPLARVLHDLVEKVKPSAIISTTLGALCVQSIARRHKLPAFVLHFQPNVPTPCFPFYLAGFDEALEAAQQIAAVGNCEAQYDSHEGNLASYDKFYAWFNDSIEDMNVINSDYEMPLLTKQSLVDMLMGRDRDVCILLSYPTGLVPKPISQSDLVVTVESLADDFIPRDWNPREQCPNLYMHIKSSRTKPLCVSVGSMSVPPDDVERISMSVLDGLRRANVENVVLIRGSGEAHLSRARLDDKELATWAEMHVFECDESVEFAWLFPLCAGLITHGGAGTVAAALRAGIPVAVVPLQCDQYFWGELVERYALGAFVRPGLLNCTADAVRNAVQRIESDEVSQKAKRYGDVRISKMSGCEAVRTVLEKSLFQKNVHVK